MFLVFIVANLQAVGAKTDQLTWGQEEMLGGWLNVNYRGGDVILVGPMTEVDPVSKGGDHIQGESVEQAERHLGIG